MARRTLSRGTVVAAATTAMVTAVAPLMSTAAQAATARPHALPPAAIAPAETIVPATFATPGATAPEHVDQLQLTGGTLLTLDHDPAAAAGTGVLHTRTVSGPRSGAQPVVGDQSTFGSPLHDPGRLYGVGTGTGAYTTLSGSSLTSPGPDATMTTVKLPVTGGTIVAANNAYTVINATDGKQYVFRNGHTTPVFTGTAGPAGLDGDRLAYTDGHQLMLHSLTAPWHDDYLDPPLTVPCPPTEIQAAGGWIYWTCGDGRHAGVDYPDGETSNAFDVPAGPSVLVPGYLLQHDLSRGELTVTDLGAADPFSSTQPQPEDLAPLPAPAAGGKDERGTVFTADPYSGDIAYVDAQQRVHVVDPGLPPNGGPVQAAELVGGTTLPQPAVVTPEKGWSAAWLLSAAVRSARITIAGPDGATVATIDGKVAGNTVTAFWNGLRPDGTRPPNGSYTFDLDVTMAGADSDSDFGKAPLTYSGLGGTFRDPRGIGLGSVTTMNSAGWLTTHTGSASRSSLDTWKSGGSGYATGDLAVPFGPLHANNCDDTLVRTTAGELRDYATGCGHVLGAATTKYTSLGTGWNQYKTLQYTGDLNDDGRPDLLAWSASTGDLYLYPGAANGRFGARVLVKANQQYVRFIAVGDLDGDGVGDLLAYDHEHTLWSMLGNGKGGFKARTSVWFNWGATYNAMIGAGDLNGDGRPDIIERGTDGKIWMNAATGKPGSGMFGGRVQVGTGWQGYKALF